MIVRELLTRFGFDVDDKPIKKFNEETKRGKKLALDLVKGLGALATAYFGLDAISRATQDFGEFEMTLNGLRAVTGAVGKDFDDLREKALQLGTETQYSANEAAQGMVELAKAGLTNLQVMEAIDGTLALAAASMGEVGIGEAATIATDTMNAFGMAASDMPMIADVMAKAVNVSSIGMKNLAESMSYAAPVARAFGLTFQETSAMVAALGSAGIKGSSAGTGLVAIMNRLAAPSNKEAVGLIKKLGLQVKNSDGSMRPFVDLIGQLQKGLKGLGKVEQGRIIKEIFGEEAMKTVTALANLSPAKLKEIKEQVGEATGSSAELAKILNQGLIPSWRRLVNVLDVGFKRVMLKVAPLMTELLGRAADAAKQFIDWADASIKAMEASGQLKRAVDALKWAFTLLAPGVTVLALKALGGALLTTVIPALLKAAVAAWGFIAANAAMFVGAAAIGLLVLLLQDLWTWMNGGDSALEGLFNSFYEFGYAVYAQWETIWEGLRVTWDGFWAGLGTAMGGALEAMFMLLSMALDGMGGLFLDAGEAIKAAFIGAFSAVQSFATGVIADLAAKVAALALDIAGVLSKVPGLGNAASMVASLGQEAAARATSITQNSSVGQTNNVQVTVPPGTNNPVAIGRAVADGVSSTRTDLARAARLRPKPIR